MKNNFLTSVCALVLCMSFNTYAKENTASLSNVITDAQQEDTESLYNLGYMYEQGLGVAENHKEAIKWYTKAANKENAHAQYHLGLLYTKGVIVTQDIKHAQEYFIKACDNGYAKGCEMYRASNENNI